MAIVDVIWVLVAFSRLEVPPEFLQQLATFVVIHSTDLTVTQLQSVIDALLRLRARHHIVIDVELQSTMKRRFLELLPKTRFEKLILMGHGLVLMGAMQVTLLSNLLSSRCRKLVVIPILSPKAMIVFYQICKANVVAIPPTFQNSLKTQLLSEVKKYPFGCVMSLLDTFVDLATHHSLLPHLALQLSQHQEVIDTPRSERLARLVHRVNGRSPNEVFLLRTLVSLIRSGR
jgi:hypothetical protein